MTIADEPLLLADTGPFCRFAEAGDAQVDALAAHLRHNLRITQDVAIELARLAGTKFPRLKQLAWKEFPGEEPITITDARLLSQIEDIARGRRRHAPGHFLEDRGEIATILVAKQIGCPVLIDERWGKETFAPRKGVATYSTEDLAVEIARAERLTPDEAFEVYRRVYHGDRSTFDARLAAAA
jgi:hypothetical protein